MARAQDYLVVEGLTKHFGGLAAVEGLDFSLAEGQILGMIGPNGAGKTTVFNLLTGFLPPTAGRASFRGQTLLGLKPHHIVNLGMARTFQLVKPFPELSLYDNIRVACYGPRFLTQGLDEKATDRRIRQVAEQVGLPGDLEQQASALGHGDLRLLDIARALMIQPELLLLDEPLSGLSSIETQAIVKLIRELNQEGITVFIIEHKLKELMKVADCIVAIDFGEKLAAGTPQEVVNHPKVIEAYLGTKDSYGSH
jgi:branched-chain amino acid transport system ATP-binding protein